MRMMYHQGIFVHCTKLLLPWRTIQGDGGVCLISFAGRSRAGRKLRKRARSEEFQIYGGRPESKRLQNPRGNRVALRTASEKFASGKDYYRKDHV